MTLTDPHLSAAQDPPYSGRYLRGNYAPVQEEVTAFDLAVTGALPPELSGRLLRIGPNPLPGTDPATYHWFMGTGRAHGVRLTDGRAEWYRNRFVRGTDVVEARGGAPVPGPSRGRDFSANTNILAIAGQTYALVEAGPLPMLLSYELETQARSSFGGTLGDAFTAHPHTDPVTGDLHSVTYYWEHERVQYQVVGTDGTVRRSVDVPVPGRPMVHDTAITGRYVAILDLPVTFSMTAALAGASLPYRWDPDHGARVGLLPRDGQAEDVVWCELPGPAYVFHPVNAYDVEDGTVVMDVARYASMFTRDASGPGEPAQLHRWTVDPVTRRVSEQLLDPRAQEFPRIDERLTGQPYRYAYTVASEDVAAGFTGLLKQDLVQGTSERLDHGAGRLTMETVFVPRQGGTAEDDGWLMAYVHDAGTGRCDVVVRHAQELAAPVATVHLPARVPFGFHSNWLPD